ncbi:fructosamine kinase family protein [Paenactinomyces guangxiensis]|uniref:Fructosamine kinase family protein n=1 Tax=Paenactinomyces guangxiensis TaxID=1490290 RepID=A0A7W1WQS7_9BACL|nr:fructosamine kinase family protein [Paenactinomyces guangxiensis]MBA4494363.1 fructosamine kinase family protein [Paenactinomyces guangxiensis]MBH8591582.1 fructosamine kinase family protein [Paenactinomyces guangxiensis]
MSDLIAEAFNLLGDRSNMIKLCPVGGGSISKAFYVKTMSAEYFVKTNENVHRDFFTKEADGLRLIKKANAILVPEVYGEYYFEGRQSAVLIMEWVEGKTAPDTDEQLGRGIARLHQTVGQAFGLEEDNYIGSLPQINGWHDEWSLFYRERRLGVQLEIGKKYGYISGSRMKKLERLMDHLPGWINHDPRPSLLHGDLWSGNWIVGPGGRPYLIDPAVSYGDFELELAFTELFGRFSQKFYQAYQEMNPLCPGYQDRKQLYQLYYLLVHLNVFGESYGSSVDRILDYYV